MRELRAAHVRETLNGALHPVLVRAVFQFLGGCDPELLGAFHIVMKIILHHVICTERPACTSWTFQTSVQCLQVWKL